MSYPARAEGLGIYDKYDKFEDLKSFKSTVAYFVNPLIYDIIEDGFPISEIIPIEKASGELETFEMKEDQTLQMYCILTFDPAKHDIPK